MSAVRRDDVELAGHDHPAVVWRGGTGAPLVYLHGLLAVDEHDPVLDALAQRYEVIAPVAPGFADLAELDEVRDVHDLALYYDDLLGALGLHGVTVAGHSFGGMAAAELAAHVPGRVGRLVLLAPLGLWDGEHPVADLFAVPITDVNALLWSDPAGAPDLLGTVLGAASGQDALMQMLVAVLQGLTTAGKFLWPLPDKGLVRRLRRITAPTLVVWGADDRLAPPWYAGAFASRIAGATVEIVDGAGHMLPYERTDDVVKLLDRMDPLDHLAAT